MDVLRRYRFAVVYFTCLEIVYLLYEWQLPGSDPHAGNALALGLVFGGFTLPAFIPAIWVQWYVGIWLGYAPGDTHAFWPRLIALQAALIVNTVLLALITRDRRSKDARSSDKDPSGNAR